MNLEKALHLLRMEVGPDVKVSVECAENGQAQKDASTIRRAWFIALIPADPAQAINVTEFLDFERGVHRAMDAWRKQQLKLGK